MCEDTKKSFYYELERRLADRILDGLREEYGVHSILREEFYSMSMKANQMAKDAISTYLDKLAKEIYDKEVVIFSKDEE